MRTRELGWEGVTSACIAVFLDFSSAGLSLACDYTSEQKAGKQMEKTFGFLFLFGLE